MNGMVSETMTTEMRELSVAVVRAAERFFKDEENKKRFEAWHEARVKKEKGGKAC